MSIQCGEGVPKRCFFLTKADGSKWQVCWCYSQWPPFIFAAYPKHPGPDPEVHIEGIHPDLMQEIRLLDMSHYIAGHLPGESGKQIQEIVQRSLKSAEGRLPAGVSFR
jgi:hypothetical protein